MVWSGDFWADDRGSAEWIRIRGHSGRRVSQRGAHHWAVGDDFSSYHRADVHSGNQFRADLFGITAHQRDWPHSPDHAERLWRCGLGGAAGYLAADDARSSQRQPDLYRSDTPADDRRVGQPGATLVRAPSSTPTASG